MAKRALYHSCVLLLPPIAGFVHSPRHVLDGVGYFTAVLEAAKLSCRLL